MEETLDRLQERMEDEGISNTDLANLVRESRQVSKELREESVPFDEHKDAIKSPFEEFVELLKSGD